MTDPGGALDSGASGPQSTSQNTRQCWICFATDEDEDDNWIQPCKCKGTTKWVHQRCLQQWVDEKHKENRERKVACPQCKTEYIIFFPKSNRLVVLLDKFDLLIYKMCPFVAAGMLVGSAYWCAVTYGAVTVMQVAGQDDARVVMERVEPAVLLTVLPGIPFTLIFFQMIRWEDSLLHLVRKCSPRIPLLNHFLPSEVRNESGRTTEVPTSDSMDCTRIFTGALLLPTIASLCGDMFFNTIPHAVHRAFLGGVSFILVKGLLKMYHKQQVYVRLSRRKILDYTPENLELVATAPPAPNLP